MSDTTTSVKTWLSKAWTTIKTFFDKASNQVHDLTVIADNLANALKNAEASNIGQFLETTVEMIIPSSTGLINAFKLWLPVVVAKLNWAVAEEGKAPQQVVADAVSYLQGLKTSDPDLYAAQLNTLNALIQKWFSDNQGAGLNIQQALATTQVVHNPDLIAQAA